jgi:hypothetical protein
MKPCVPCALIAGHAGRAPSVMQGPARAPGAATLSVAHDTNHNARLIMTCSIGMPCSRNRIEILFGSKRL